MINKFIVNVSSIYIPILMTIILNGCTNPSQNIYNCNEFTVDILGKNNFKSNIERKSFFFARKGGEQFDNKIFVYPDGSHHRPKIISYEKARVIHRRIGIPAPSNYVELNAICAAFGPGIVIIQND